jgi:type II restriction enzyme
LNLQMDYSLAARFTSASQQARVVTESWAQENLYCVGCDSERLSAVPTNTQVVDFRCERCSASFQLKSQCAPFGNRITDSGYDAMCRAIREDRYPNLIALHYDRSDWCVRNVILIPSFGFSLASVEKRKPLGPSARRAGWIGCNILLSSIPDDLRLPLVTDSRKADSAVVREHYRVMSTLRSMDVSSRGWLIDVLNVARSINKQEFHLSEMYSQDKHLRTLHPKNFHIRPKIRQQLQKLRDMGLLTFIGEGNYRWSSTAVR